MIPRTFPSTYASNGQQQMVVYFLSSVTGLQRWADYIPVRLAQGGVENSYNNNGYIDVTVVSSPTATQQAWKEYIPVYLDDSATDAWLVNAVGYIPYGYALFGDASMIMDMTNTGALDSRVTFTRSTTGTRFNSAGTLESVAIDGPRFDYNPTTLAARGLLIEEQRTNSIRNNMGVGAVAGTPGTLPTNWTSQSVGGVALTEVVGSGVEDGIAYVDVRYAGTTSSTATGGILAEGPTDIAASVGQTWAHASYVRLVAGSLSGITSLNIALFGRSAVGSLLESTIVAFTPTNALLRTQRYAATRTLNNALVAFVQPRVTLAPVSGAAIDITLRIGLPQLELGAFSTSVITTTAAAATRTADVASMTGTNFSDWYNASEGTLFAEYSAVASGTRTAVDISDNTANESIRLRTVSADPKFTVTDGGVDQADIDAGTVASSVIYKFAGAYKLDDFAAAINGGTVGTDTSGTLPTVNQMMLGNSAAANYLNGYLRRVAYFPTRISNAQLQAVTA